VCRTPNIRRVRTKRARFKQIDRRSICDDDDDDDYELEDEEEEGRRR